MTKTAPLPDEVSGGVGLLAEADGADKFSKTNCLSHDQATGLCPFSFVHFFASTTDTIDTVSDRSQHEYSTSCFLKC